MRALHLFFQLHQPYSLKAPEGGEHEYFGGGADFREANQKYYQPFFALLERNTQRYPGLKVSLLVSGAWLDQAELYEPDLVRRLQKLVDLKQVELVATPYYYSLSAFYDKDEFAEQMALFKQKFEGKFSTKCQVLATPGLMYHDKLAKWAEKAGLRGALAGDGAGVLGFRNAGRVYDAVGCEDFRVLFENGRLSQALVRGEDLVLAESLPTAEDFEEASKGADEESAEITRNAAMRKRATAAEFVRGRAGAAQVRAHVATGARKVQPAGKKMYSAKKLQKEIDIVCLRGNLVSLCLDARMFGAHRDEGVVACFDEFFMNWLKVPGNKFLTASEVFETAAFAPTAEISVKSTVRTRGLVEDFVALEGKTGSDGASSAQDSGSAHGGSCSARTSGLARVEEVQYTLPEGFRTDAEDKLYGLRARVLKTKNEDLQGVFRKLSVMDYAFGKFREDFGKVLDDFEAQVEELLPKPKRLRAENDGENADEDTGEAELTASRTADELKGVTGDEEPEPENDYTVKVHRILKKASAEWAPRPEDFELESGEEGFDETDGLEDDAEELEDWEDAQEGDLAEDFEDGADDEEGEDDGAEDMMDAFDAAEAEVQVIAQRMKRSKQVAERELEALMEAEVVSAPDVKSGAKGGMKSATKAGAKSGTDEKKKKTRRRIVLD